MICQYQHLSQHPSVFRTMTGLSVTEFDALYEAVQGYYVEATWARLDRLGRQREIGAGARPALKPYDQILLTVVWLRMYPTYEVLGYLFGVSDTTAGWVASQGLPMLGALGRDTMRLPQPGRKRRRHLDDLRRDIPEFAVVIDSFEQRVQRPETPAEAEAFYSGKKKMHTLKSQVAVDEATGGVVDVSISVLGPTADPLAAHHSRPRRLGLSEHQCARLRQLSAPQATWQTPPTRRHRLQHRLFQTAHCC